PRELRGGLQEYTGLAFVVGDPPRVCPAVAHRELERVALPELERRGRLHVEVAVDEHGGRVGRTGGSPELAEREKPLAERRELGRPARGTDEGADPLAGAAHV